MGSTRNPAVVGMPMGNFPPPKEHAEIAASIDWDWVANRLRSCDAVALVVDDDDLEALRDAVANRLGFEVIARSQQPGTLCICWRAALEVITSRREAEARETGVGEDGQPDPSAEEDHGDS